MGSRITRAIYKDERKQPIKKQREEEIKTLIVCFLGSINTIYFFLFGYLFRPHIRAPDSIAIFLTILILFLYLQLRQISRATLITSVALFLAVIITKVIGIELSLLKAVLILITTSLSAVSGFQIASSPFLQTLFLWLAYSSFGLGVKLSLVISKIKLENNQVEALSKEEAFLVQLVFSLVGVMSVFLISFGKKILKIKPNDTQKHTIFGKQFVYASLNFILMAFSFGFKQNLQNSFLIELFMVFIALSLFIIINKTSFSDYTWTIVCLFAVISHLLNFLTEDEGQIAVWVNSGKMVMIELAITDSVQRWINWSRHGGHQPILIVFLYFSAFYLSQFSIIGVKVLVNFSITAMEVVAMSSYVVLRALHHFDKATAQDYEEVVV